MLEEKKVFKGFESGVCCSMAVFGELSKYIGLDQSTAKKIAASFGSGMYMEEDSWNASPCGCVSATLMALGYFYGNDDIDQNEKRNLMMLKRKKFIEKFNKKFGSVNCIQLLNGLNPGNSVERKKIVERGLMKTVCAPMVCETCKLALEVMNIK